jgi:hypothetical protein
MTAFGEEQRFVASDVEALGSSQLAREGSPLVMGLPRWAPRSSWTLHILACNPTELLPAFSDQFPSPTEPRPLLRAPWPPSPPPTSLPRPSWARPPSWPAKVGNVEARVTMRKTAKVCVFGQRLLRPRPPSSTLAPSPRAPLPTSPAEYPRRLRLGHRQACPTDPETFARERGSWR